MIIRRVLGILAVLTILVGATQVLFTNWWIEFVPAIFEFGWILVTGILVSIFGLLLLVAASRRLIGLGLLMKILGLIMLIVGLAFLLQPYHIARLAHDFVLARSHFAQARAIVVGGLVRVLIGVLMLYALANPPLARPIMARPHRPAVG